MKINKLCAALVVALPALAYQNAGAHEAVFGGALVGASENPPSSSTAIGVGTVTIDFDLVTMRVQETFSGLSGTTTASHIHCCTTDPFAGNVGVATQLPSFSGFPLGVSSGTFDQTFDMSLASSYNPAFVTANGSVGGAFNALVGGLESGRAYLNIHTTAFPGGEIRALLAPVPEPETYALMLAGLAVMVPLMRRARRNAQR
jgi:hypothetical protein